MTTYFSHGPLKSDNLFSYLVTTPTLSAFQLRLFSVLCKFTRVSSPRG